MKIELPLLLKAPGVVGMSRQPEHSACSVSQPGTRQAAQHCVAASVANSIVF
eukprot:COSAG06_NODE_33556_length_488_cov_0.462725_1_plen_51_part_10